MQHPHARPRFYCRLDSKAKDICLRGYRALAQNRTELPDLGGLVCSLPRAYCRPDVTPTSPPPNAAVFTLNYDNVRATGIEPVLLFRVMEALSHLAQHASPT